VGAGGQLLVLGVWFWEVDITAPAARRGGLRVQDPCWPKPRRPRSDMGVGACGGVPVPGDNRCCRTHRCGGCRLRRRVRGKGSAGAARVATAAGPTLSVSSQSTCGGTRPSGDRAYGTRHEDDRVIRAMASTPGASGRIWTPPVKGMTNMVASNGQWTAADEFTSGFGYVHMALPSPAGSSWFARTSARRPSGGGEG